MISLKRAKIMTYILLVSKNKMSAQFSNRQSFQCLSSVRIWRIIRRKTCSVWNFGCKASHCTFLEEPQKKLFTRSHGVPHRIVKAETFMLDKPKAREVIAKVLSAPVSIEEIKTIHGTFPVKPTFPFVPGNEAVMEILEIGSDVMNLKVGDRVMPNLNAMGTWRTAIVAEESSFIKIPADIDVITASLISLYPCCAYRMLTDFVNLKPGDVVIQNCPNSAVSQAVIQIAAAKGIHTVTVIREKPNFDEVKNQLILLGATRVVSERELRNRNPLGELSRPILALSGFTGNSSVKLLKHLANGGTMIFYGGVEPQVVGVNSLICHDLKLRGFSMTTWNKLRFNDLEKQVMLKNLFDLSRKGKFTCCPHITVPFEYYRAALYRTFTANNKYGFSVQVLI